MVSRRHRLLAGGVLLASPLALSLASVVQRGGSEKLSAPLGYELVQGGITFVEVSDDGQWVVFFGHQAPESERGIYSVPADGSAPPVRLSGSLPVNGLFQISPDATRVLFYEFDFPNPPQLYSAPIDGGLPAVRLNDPLASGDEVYTYEGALGFTPDGQTAVFIASLGGIGQALAVPVDGSASPVPLDPTPTAGGDVNVFEITPDGATVVLQADFEQGGKLELFRAPIGGGVEPVRISGDMQIDGDVQATFRITPDGSRVVYVADATTDNAFQLYSAPVDGSSPALELSPTPAPGGDVQAFEIGPTGFIVVYRADQDVNDVENLYKVSVDGSYPATLVNTTSTEVFGFHVSPAGDRIVYDGIAPSGNRELYGVPVNASSGPVQLSDLPPSAGANVLADHLLAPAAGRAVYLADRDANDVFELFSVPIDGSAAPTKLSGHLVPGGDVLNGFQVTGGGTHVVYRADATFNNAYELYGVPADGSSAASRLHPDLPVGGEVDYRFVVSEDAALAAFFGDVEVNGVAEVFSAPADASQPATKLNGPLPTVSHTADVASFHVSPDGKWAAYVETLTLTATYQTGVYGVPLATDGGARRISGPGLSQFASDILFSPDSRFVFYRQSADAFLLFRAPVDGSAPPVLVSQHSLGPQDTVGGVVVAPDGVRVSYTVSTYLGSLSLWSALADGSAPPDIIGGGVQARFTPDSQTIVYRTLNDFGAETIVSAPADGSGPNTVLTPTNPPSSFALIRRFALTPDGTRVVYVSDRDTAGVYQLFSVPVDGSAPETELNAPLVSGGDVTGDFLFSADGMDLIYLADQDTDERFELFRVPVDGSQPPVRVSGNTLQGRVVPDSNGGPEPFFALTPDGSRLVFLAEQNGNDTYELYSTPADGSAQPVKLNGAFVAGGDVDFVPCGFSTCGAYRRGFDLTPDGGRVVYLADQEVDDVFELYSTPVDGTGAPVKLHFDLAGGRDVEAGFAFSPDSTRVFFRGNLVQNGREELFEARVDGTGVLRRRNGELTPGGNVEDDFVVHPTGKWVLYRADEDTDDDFELFRFLRLGTRRAETPVESVER